MRALDIAGLYAIASLATFLIYALDKSAARRQSWRVPERLLHALGLLGGWPGGLAAQWLLRHKSRKLPFLAVFWLTAGVNLCFLWELTRS
jgi:uncharacterized membrane protein YsdA (DUF1294 family)